MDSAGSSKVGFITEVVDPCLPIYSRHLGTHRLLDST